MLQARRHIAVGTVERGKERARQFQFADDDTEDDGENLVELNCRMDLAAGLEQRLQPDNLLGQKSFTEFHRAGSSNCGARAGKKYMRKTLRGGGLNKSPGARNQAQ